MNKRFLSVVLVFVMMLSQFSFVFANETKDYEKSWAENDIMEWLDEGYITTYKDGKFRPKQNITRAEFIQVINKAFDIPKTEEIVEFTDVTEDHLFFEDIQKGKAFGYIGGYPDGSFKPDGYITREEASKTISVMLGVYKYYTDDIPEIKDYDKIGDWAKEHVKFLITKGVIKGYPDGNFMGKNNITREEAVAILKRMHTAATSYTGIEVAAINGESLVENAAIKLYTDEYELIKEGLTDESGYLDIKDMKPGNYFLIIEDENKEKIYSQKVAVKNNFVTYKQGQIQDSVKATGLLVDQDGKKAPADTALVFISQSKFVTHTLDNGIIETSLLPNNKYTVFLKQDKLERIGEVSVEDGNTNIGTLKYTKPDKKAPNKGESVGGSSGTTPETPEIPGYNDNTLPVIKLNTSSLEEYPDEGMY
ncbi:MAG TPA: S-layer homology domain-containing protein [Epulopiscium sp.]|nr:S-layer homology domain-containing protein [Candidatus Epulonipiscium sp.]